MSCPLGEKHRQEAEKALARTSIFGFGKRQKYEDAAENFKVAANAFKLADMFKESGDCYMRASECFKQADDSATTDYVNMIVEAGNVYKRNDLGSAIQAFNKAIAIYCETSRLSQAARYQKEVAEIFDNDNNKEMALKAYEQAADLYSKDNKKTNAKDCLLKVATIASTTNFSLSGAQTNLTPQQIEVQNLQKAAAIFEQVGKESMESKLGSYSAKGYFFQCLLCLLALGDNVAAENKLNEFKNSDYTFPNCRECQFIEKLIESINNVSVDDFSNHCSDFDRITPLDPWKTTILLKIKQHIAGGEGDGEGDVDLT